MSKQTANLFNHRLDATKVNDALEVQDQFNLIAEHAKGVLYLLHIQFEDQDRVSDEIIQNGIDSVIYQIDDMKSVINAHFDLHKEVSK